jgi:hypothetical protein
VVYAVTSGEAAPYLGTPAVQIRTSLSGRSVIEGKVLRSDDTADDPGATPRSAVVYSPRAHHFDEGRPDPGTARELIAAHISHANLFEAEPNHSRYDRPLTLCLLDSSTTPASPTTASASAATSSRS